MSAKQQTAEQGAARAADAAQQRRRKGDQAALGAVLAEGPRVIECKDKGSRSRQGSSQGERPPYGAIPVHAHHLRQFIILRDRSNGPPERRAEEDVGGYSDEEYGSHPHEHIRRLQDDLAHQQIALR